MPMFQSLKHTLKFWMRINIIWMRIWNFFFALFSTPPPLKLEILGLSLLFVIFSLNNDENNDILTSSTPNVVWSANPKNPVSYNATLHLTSDRGLVLQDVDGTIAWSTSINSNKYVAGVSLTNMCNLQHLDENNATIWLSFDHPTDTLVIRLKFGARAATY